MSRIGDAMKRAGAPGLGLDSDFALLTHEQPTEAAAPTGEPRETGEVASAIDADSIRVEPSVDASGSESLPLDVTAEPVLRGGNLLSTLAPRAEKLVANARVQPVIVEQYRRLAAILHQAQSDRGIRRILIASALPEEGKTLTACNLALTLSESYGRRVLLVDADLRRPGVNLTFGMATQPGLSEALDALEPRKLPVVQLSPTLSVLPAGRPTTDPMQRLTSLRMAQILEEASEAFDWVIVDSPPVALLPDAKLLAHMVDTVLLVISAGTTPFAPIQLVVDAFGRDSLFGVVLNRVEGQVVAANQYDYYHYSATPRAEPRAGWLTRWLPGHE